MISFDEQMGVYTWSGEHEIVGLAASQAALAHAAELQAQIDALMLEYCPDEMTAEQLAEWGRHQRPAQKPLSESEIDAIFDKHHEEQVNASAKLRAELNELNAKERQYLASQLLEMQAEAEADDQALRAKLVLARGEFSAAERNTIASQPTDDPPRPRCSVCKDTYEECSKNYGGGWVGTKCPEQ